MFRVQEYRIPSIAIGINHPATSEENTGPSLNHLLITSSADIYLSSSTPNCIHLLTSTWIDSTIRLTSKDVTVIGSEQTIITTVSRNQLADNHRNQCDSDSSANCASSSVFSIQNTTLSLASLTFDLISGIVFFVLFILPFRTTKPGFLVCVLSELEFSCFSQIGDLPCGCSCLAVQTCSVHFWLRISLLSHCFTLHAQE
ncbi:hypothetical protein BLNAU_20288 [Blattamonas nauphoetae]|uniref:Uncharacterized protein n=1 Tax=Blattamonas nauphoetae TaxID=2049346 RepID=A0ABQ9X3D6_9EUKA|nr:hypothetical protein BLNAU_20288 [Blattamonas nauphoetae]